VLPCAAWDTPPHQLITRAALGRAPRKLLVRLGAEAAALERFYCIYPDLYLEMIRYGFVRKDGGAKSAAQIRPYCVRPDGEVIHGIGGDGKSDLASVTYLLEQMVANLDRRQPGEAARFAGVLSHFVEDSLSPPHSVTAARLDELAPELRETNLHSALEHSIPEFQLPPRDAAKPLTLAEAAAAIVRSCYAGAEINRAAIPAMVRAVAAQDRRSLDRHRLRAGTLAAEILTEAFTQWNRLATPL
jgi:hypothetical protein